MFVSFLVYVVMMERETFNLQINLPENEALMLRLPTTESFQKIILNSDNSIYFSLMSTSMPLSTSY